VKSIKKFYKRTALDLLMFAHVKALTSQLPFTTDKAIQNFIKYYEITDEDVNFDSLRVTYFRMQREFQESLKVES
jgi:hypothetical protein